MVKKPDDIVDAEIVPIRGEFMSSLLLGSAVTAIRRGDLEGAAAYLESLGNWIIDIDPQGWEQVGETRFFKVRS